MECIVLSQAVFPQLISILHTNTNTKLRRTKYARWSAAVAFMLICGVAPVSAQFASNKATVAQPCSAHDAIRFRGLSVWIENDLFVHTDQNYTNGLAFTAVSHDLVGQLKPECLTLPVRLQTQIYLRATNAGNSSTNPVYTSESSSNYEIYGTPSNCAGSTCTLISNGVAITIDIRTAIWEHGYLVSADAVEAKGYMSANNIFKVTKIESKNSG